MNKPAVVKALKVAGLVLLGILGFVVLLVLLLPLWLGPVVRPIANATVSDITGAKFNLGQLSLNPYVGTLHVGDMQLSNPTNGGYKVEENCVELGKLDVDVDMGTILSKKIVVSSIELDGLTVRTTLAGGNFMQIAENASGGKVEEAPAAEEQPVEEAPADGEGPKVQIDRLVLKNITIKYGGVPVPIPTLTIEGIGADKPEGASVADAFTAIKDKVLAAGGAVTGKLGELGSSAADAVGEHAGKAAEAIGEHAGKAAEAIGEHAGKAVDAVKGLFK